MNDYFGYIRLPRSEDFVGIVLPNKNIEFSTLDNTANNKDGWLMFTFEADKIPQPEDFFNMWLKFNVQYFIFTKEELDKTLEDSSYEPKPLFLIKGTNDVPGKEIKSDE